MLQICMIDQSAGHRIVSTFFVTKELEVDIKMRNIKNATGMQAVVNPEWEKSRNIERGLSLQSKIWV